MGRLIDIDEITQVRMCETPLIHTDNSNTYYFQMGWNMAIDTICECAPTAKVVHPKDGHWIHKYDAWVCSECYYAFHGKPLWKYCPHCGAKNEVEDDNNN